MNKELKKDRMFQYAYEGLGTTIVEDTGLITKEEAYALWDKYYEDFIINLKNDCRPQMVIWGNCESETDYCTEEKELDWRDDLEIEGNNIYKITKQLIV